MPHVCMLDGCDRRANYDYIGGVGQYCSHHKKSDMINISIKRCKQQGCLKCPSYGLEKGRADYCRTHKSVLMYDVKSKLCNELECKKQAIFGLENCKPLFCSQHRKDGMIDVKNKKCTFPGCHHQPTYGIPGGKSSRCKVHKEPHMNDIRHKRCEYSGCSVRPTFNYIGLKGKYCNEHKLDGMIDVTAIFCISPGCTITNPCFDYIGGKGRYCKTHMLPGMVDVKHKTSLCISEGCTTRASFGVINGIPEYCKKHKTSAMSLLIYSKKCIICNKQAVFDIPTGKGTYCADHKSDAMINVVSTKCAVDTCDTTASYGRPHMGTNYCFKHRLPGTVRRPNGLCQYSSCKQRAMYGINNTLKHCVEHKLYNEINYTEISCKSCGLMMVLDSDDLCEYCNPTSFKSVKMLKQKMLIHYLQSRAELPNPTMIDTMIDKGVCGKERPDIVYELSDKVIIVECDEHQHHDRDDICESTRMKNIGQTYGGMPVFFIRWNPDKYIPASNVSTIDSLAKRQQLLGDLIRDIIHDSIILPYNALVSVLYLYYDGWSGLLSESWNTLVLYEN